MVQCGLCGKDTNSESNYCHECRWRTRWPEEVLVSPKLASRRKRSHNAEMLYIDRDKPEAIFKPASEHAEGIVYVASLNECTCNDFIVGHGNRPCKHIFRLAEELGLFQCEYFSDDDYDYTLIERAVHGDTLPVMREKPSQLTSEILESWKQELYSCRSIYKAFKFFEELQLKKSQLMEFAQYLGVNLHKYDDKHRMLSKIIYATVGEKLKDNPVRRRNVSQYTKNNLVYKNNGIVEATFVVSLSFEDKPMERPSYLPSYEQLEEWKNKLKQCRIREEGIRLIYDLKLKIPDIRELARYMDINMEGCKYLKVEIIKWLVDAVIKQVEGNVADADSPNA